MFGLVRVGIDGSLIRKAQRRPVLSAVRGAKKIQLRHIAGVGGEGVYNIVTGAPDGKRRASRTGENISAVGYGRPAEAVILGNGQGADAIGGIADERSFGGQDPTGLAAHDAPHRIAEESDGGGIQKDIVGRAIVSGSAVCGGVQAKIGGHQHGIFRAAGVHLDVSYAEHIRQRNGSLKVSPPLVDLIMKPPAEWPF